MSGFVYFVAPEALLHRSDDSLVKIGFTNGHPRFRLRNLQCGSPLPLVLWAYVEGGTALERAFHEAFADLRAHGEWFYVADKLRDFLAYLGEEPNIGNLISRERLEVALHDVLFCDWPSHPSIDEGDWLRSCRTEALKPYFPDVWSERYA